MILTREDQIALKLYKKIPGPEAARRAGISYHRLRSLITVNKVKSENYYWTPAQDKILMDNYTTMKKTEIAKLCKKTIWGVYHRHKILTNGNS